MKVTTILGSPRTQGNTASVLAMVEKKLADSGHHVERFDIARMKVNGCLGCMKCQRPSDGPACVQKDDLSQIFESMSGSDAVIYASPVYAWGPTAQLKAMLDRQLSLLHDYGTPQMGCYVEGRRLAQLVTAMGPREDNAQLMERPFEKMAHLMGCTSLGTFLVPGTFDPEAVAKNGSEVADRLVSAVLGE